MCCNVCDGFCTDANAALFIAARWISGKWAAQAPAILRAGCARGGACELCRLELVLALTVPGGQVQYHLRLHEILVAEVPGRSAARVIVAVGLIESCPARLERGDRPSRLGSVASMGVKVAGK